MGTTINTLVDRQGGACVEEDYERILDKMRGLLADTEALLELELERLRAEEFDETDKTRLKELSDFVGKLQKLLRDILDTQAKVAEHRQFDAIALNLEAAREEVLSRLARLAA